MIDSSVLLAFVATSAVVILVPGSDMFLLLRLSLTRGVAAGVQALGGIHLGNAIQAALMISGVGLLVSRIPFAIIALKVIGAAYLLYLAITSWRSVLSKKSEPSVTADGRSDSTKTAERGSSAFGSGLLTNVTNPKVLLFFVAFFPQFLGSASNIPLQLLMLSVVFIALAIVWELIIVLGAAKLGATMTSANFSRVMDTICAIAFTILAVLILVP